MAVPVTHTLSLSPVRVRRTIRSFLRESCRVKERFSDSLLDRIWEWVEASKAALDLGRRIFFLGNGGSAADAQHLAAELVGRFRCRRRGLPAIALTTNSSVLTAISNDFSFEDVFLRQVEALVAPGDVVVGITTSGRSRNVIRALRLGRAKGAVTVCLTGANGERLRQLVHLLIAVPSRDTQRIQEAHITIGHIYCELLDSYFGTDADPGRGVRNAIRMAQSQPSLSNSRPAGLLGKLSREGMQCRH